MNIVNERVQIIAQLKARRNFAKQYDKEQLAKHREAEKQALLAFRAELKAAMKLPYAKAKKLHGGFRNGVKLTSPACPVPFASKLEQAIRQLELDGRKKITISPDGHTKVIHQCLMFDPTKRRTLCDD